MRERERERTRDGTMERLRPKPQSQHRGGFNLEGMGGMSGSKSSAEINRSRFQVYVRCWLEVLCSHKSKVISAQCQSLLDPDHKSSLGNQTECRIFG
ncbi:hypothetical protein MPTK1_7g10550 [Marchantia polymorpha subsp. ruderalis]|uniref:Uncharacterized protein n=2 Tax=Marchantia polymorpha TaxID=3197 RepID=A0AAF6BY49_MARPO|nr:hypothetical protein MARPO_0003s0074 [Marchantia polymorpha]BBN16933.1 hypothetical protein Mp_7g10550 [Marchantia polymorpha subsp. ruderalis]|eukprot:PTQ49174.1 hypothetical protein MARPO_0003s0074 [Marchantia polymorpha]